MPEIFVACRVGNFSTRYGFSLDPAGKMRPFQDTIIFNHEGHEVHEVKI